MSDTEAISVSTTIGWKATDDGNHVLFGLQDHTGSEFALAVEATYLYQFAALAIDATQAAATDDQTRFVIQSNWYEVATTADPQGVVLSLTTLAGAQLSFQMDELMARRLWETLGVALGSGATVQKREKPVN